MNIGINRRNGNRTICRYNLRGMCRFGEKCRNIHNNLEEKVEKQFVEKPLDDNMVQEETLGACALPPTSPLGKENVYGPGTSSTKQAISLIRISESKDKTCGICFEIIVSKGTKNDQMFGILPNCNHCFCFSCIKTWRKSKEVDFDVSKACPECRIASEYVYPSKHWLDNKEEKTKFIDSHKQRMNKLNCRYFNRGVGVCPFGNTCLYRHALPNGKILDVGPPRPKRRRDNDSAELQQLVEEVLMLGPHILGSDSEDEFDLDLSDPQIAVQYYDKDDIEYYIAMDQLLNDVTDDEGDDSDDFMSH